VDLYAYPPPTAAKVVFSSDSTYLGKHVEGREMSNERSSSVVTSPAVSEQLANRISRARACATRIGIPNVSPLTVEAPWTALSLAVSPVIERPLYTEPQRGEPRLRIAKADAGNIGSWFASGSKDAQEIKAAGNETKLGPKTFLPLVNETREIVT